MNVLKIKKAMYGNIDSPLLFFKKKQGIMERLGLKQSQTDPCLFYQLDKMNNLELLLTLHVDDMLLSGWKSAVKKYLSDLQKELKIEILGLIHKHLGVWWEWKTDENGDEYLEASMDGMVDEITEAFYKATGQKAKVVKMPGYPGEAL